MVVKRRRTYNKKQRAKQEPRTVFRRGDEVALRTDLTCIGVVASIPRRRSTVVRVQWPNKDRLYLHATEGLEKIV